MKEVFYHVLEASLYGSIVIIAVLALRLLLKRSPRWLVCLLWLLAAARLVMPFSIESGISLQPRLNYIQVEQTTGENVTAVVTPQPPDQSALPQPEQSAGQQTGINPVPEQTGNSPAPQPQEVPKAADFGEIAAWIWAAGMAALLANCLVSYGKLKRQVSDACRDADGCWECAGIETAFVLGYFPPKIYLPTRLSGEVRDCIIAHEKTHIARGDHCWKLIGYLVLCLHWFNPLVWLGYHLLCRDMEMACDERVIRDMDLPQRKAYSHALLSCAGKHRTVSVCPVAFGETSAKQRILSVLNYKKPGFWISILAVAALLFVAVCLLTNPGGENLQTVCGISRNQSTEVWLRTDGSLTVLSSEGEMDEMYRTLRDIACEPQTLQETPGTGYMLVNGEREILFSRDCGYAWTADGSAWRIEEPEALETWFARMLESVQGRDTAGEPFADLSQPLEWMRGIFAGAVSSAEIYAEGETTREGNTTSTTCSMGYFAARRFDGLLEILNALPDDALVEETTQRRTTFLGLRNNLSDSGGVCVTIFDQVNALAAVLQLDGKDDSIRLILTDELDKTEDSVTYLEHPWCYRLEDAALRDYLKELWQYPPIVQQLLPWPVVENQPSEVALARVQAALEEFQAREDYHISVHLSSHTGNYSDWRFWQAGEEWLSTYKVNGELDQVSYMKKEDENEHGFYHGRMDWTGDLVIDGEDAQPIGHTHWLRTFDWRNTDIRVVQQGMQGENETITCILTGPFEVYRKTAYAGVLTLTFDGSGNLAAAELIASYEEALLQTDELTREQILNAGGEFIQVSTQVLPTSRAEILSILEDAYSQVSPEEREKAIGAVYLFQCKAALEAVQSMEYYHIRAAYEFYQGTYKEAQHTADYWFDGENLLRTAEVNGMTHMTLLHNGSVYQSRTYEQSQWNRVREENGTTEDVAPWIMYYVWNDGVVKYRNAVAAEDQVTVFLEVDQPATIEGMYAESYELLFTFDSEGNLLQVSLGTRNPDGAAMIQNIFWIDSDYDEIQAEIENYVYAVQYAE